jgi:hypothetical protein
MFAVINRHQAIPGYSHGTVVSLHLTERAALLADLRLQADDGTAHGPSGHAPLFVLSLAVKRRCGEHVRLTDLSATAARRPVRFGQRRSR